ncbi:DUF2291 domain-containing protein [Croceibacterium sp. TMG7-5b_MA50]|uniref:DUF2291 family protein n=1 Tax=Croceibacterium sp. TMG7-5b_MA50 TaxID=3121290 RepID=UPI003221D1E7
MRITCIAQGVWRGVAIAGLLVPLAGCTVVPLDEVAAVRARDSGAFDLARFMAETWPTRVEQELGARAIPLDRLGGPLDELGESRGNRAGEGSPWTFAVRGTGVVRRIDRDGPRGRMEVQAASGPVLIQTGPVVSGSTIRDAMPSITFDGFPDQISFAKAGMALTDAALQRLEPTLSRVAVGDRVTFVGTVSANGGVEPPVVTPIQLAIQ